MEALTAEALNAQFGITDHVTFHLDAAGMVRVEIANDQAEAEIALQGAQVLAFEPHGAAPVLFRSTRAVYAPGRPVRGGIPICWPWFGPHPTDPHMPQHGIVRTLPWSVLDTRQAGDGSTIVLLGVHDTAETLALWPYPFDLTLTVQVGRALVLALDTANEGDEPLPLSEALHSYFQIGDVAAVRVHGLDGTTYVDKVDGGWRKVQDGAVTLAGETDRVHMGTTGACVIEDPVLQRHIRIAKEGSRSTVVWNPGPEKAAQLPDLGTDEYIQMICVEVGNALDNSLVLAPGATHRLGLTIEVTPG